jgi:acetyl esterase
MPLAICGDSAGGHIAVGVAQEAARRGLPIAALALLYPVADPEMTTPSWRRYGRGHVLTRTWMAWAWTCYLGQADPLAPAFTLLKSELELLPPTLIVTALCDPLRDEGEALAAAINAVGGHADVECAPGMIHGFASLPMLTATAGRTLSAMGTYLRQHMC